jgi:hypothetical protein
MMSHFMSQYRIPPQLASSIINWNVGKMPKFPVILLLDVFFFYFYMGIFFFFYFGTQLQLYICSTLKRKSQFFYLPYESVSDCCLTPNEQFFSYIMARTSYIQWHDVHFVLDQHTELNFYSASSLKQQSEVFALTP